jgi:hypothetical protein
MFQEIDFETTNDVFNNLLDFFIIPKFALKITNLKLSTQSSKLGTNKPYKLTQLIFMDFKSCHFYVFLGVKNMFKIHLDVLKHQNIISRVFQF